MSSALTRRNIPLGLAGLTGLLIVAQFFVVSNEVDTAASAFLDWAAIFAGFALCVGSANLMAFHGKRISRKSERWYYSVLLLVIMFIFIAVGLTLTTSSGAYLWMFNVINYPLSQVGFSLLAFYIFSAAVRAFQARNWEASVFLVCAMFTVLANIPSTSLFLPQFGNIGTWINDVPTRGAFRGLIITAAIGGIILGMRTLMGRESAYLGRGG